ncbi:cupin domain-containing protein [Helicobacter baculiformis]|uniref:Cupin domain-containing protein n=1 Tax=Helicobacter baculiformis TaxID=427351 RepID=A0ABV7ZEW5_9HELI|nr:cupin domain-containing protein [Helicobacter baculiformis]
MPILRFLEDVKFDSLYIQMLLETATSKEIRIVMPKDKEMHEHYAPGAIMVRVLSGQIWFEVEGKRHILRVGDCIALDAHIRHSLGGLEDSVLNLSLSKLDNVQRVLDVASSK